jgi:hypothetical protein
VESREQDIINSMTPSGSRLNCRAGGFTPEHLMTYQECTTRIKKFTWANGNLLSTVLLRYFKQSSTREGWDGRDIISHSLGCRVSKEESKAALPLLWTIFADTQVGLGKCKS